MDNESKESLQNNFVHEMIRRIIMNEFHIGQRLPVEREFCEEFHVSRSVVNKGLKQLKEMGFIDIIPRKGSYVRDFYDNGSTDVLDALLRYNGETYNPQYFRSIFEARLLFEPAVLALAAQNRISTDIHEAESILARMKQESDLKKLSLLCVRFFHLLFVAGGNPVIAAVMNPFRSVYDVMSYALFSTGYKDDWIEKAGELLDAIRKRDPDSTRRAGIELIETDRSWIARHFEPDASFRKPVK